jgi:hypothetical protein
MRVRRRGCGIIAWWRSRGLGDVRGVGVREKVMDVRTNVGW